MSPRTCTRSEVATAWVPLGVGQSIVVSSAEQLDAGTPFLLLVRALATRLVKVEIQVPELELRLRGRANRSENDVPAAGRPPDGVACPPRQ